MSDLSKCLDMILEDESPEQQDAVQQAAAIANSLEAARQRVYDLQWQLQATQNRICADLAIRIRKQLPGLNVAVNRNGCKVGYKSKHLLLYPNASQGVWDIKSSDNRFTRKFFSRHSRKTIITPGHDELIGAIIKHFSEHYKSLGEDIVGTGVILVEDRRATLAQLFRWRDETPARPVLRTRATR